MDSAPALFFDEELLSKTSQPSDVHTKGIYDQWAHNYDKVSNGAGYKAHKLCAEIFDRTLENLHGDLKNYLRILDAGAGTGMVGYYLKGMGYTHVDALDISQNMLKWAKEKNVYTNLICAPLCEEVISEIATGAYDATVCVGTIAVGHVKPTALDEMVRHVKPGGIICFTIRPDIYVNEAEFGYKSKMEELESVGKWELVSKELIDYFSNLGELRSKCYAVIYKVLKSH